MHIWLLSPFIDKSHQVQKCGLDEFKCTNDSKCIPLHLKCDGNRDCADNSDEDTKQTCKYYSSECGTGLFECRDGSACLNASAVCDKKSDCRDASDEVACGVNECAASTPCEQKCVEQPAGFRCECRTGFRLMRDRVSCEDVDECSVENTPSRPCSQLCHNTVGSFKCTCQSGYTLLGDQRTCRADSSLLCIFDKNLFVIFYFL